MCHNTLTPARTPRLIPCHNKMTPAKTPRLEVCHNTLTPARTPRLGLCHNTLTPARTPRLVPCHNKLTPAKTPRLEEYHNTLTPARIPRRPELCRNTLTYQQHQGLGCVTTRSHQQGHQYDMKMLYALHIIMCGLSSWHMLLAYQQPPSRNGEKSSEEGVWLSMSVAGRLT